MTETDTYEDHLLFTATASDLLEAVRAAASGDPPKGTAAYLLERAQLLTDGSLTEPGRALFRLAWVLRRKEDAERALGQALRALVPIQVMEQELRGLGPIPEEGLVDLLRHHRSIPPQMSADELRPTLKWLSRVRVVVYSQKMKTVRTEAPPSEAALAGEVQAIAGMVSPRTPFMNIVRLRRVIRGLRGTVWWVDAHFGARALEEIAEEVDTNRVHEVRILSGDATNVLTTRSLKDFARFRDEMDGMGVEVDWRIDEKAARDWHDRWLADDKQVWNVPPVNTLFKNDYSEILSTSERPPLDDWWRRSVSRHDT